PILGTFGRWRVLIWSCRLSSPPPQVCAIPTPLAIGHCRVRCFPLHSSLMNIAIIGIEGMGSSLAQLIALAGHNVAIYDVDSLALAQVKLAIARNLDQQLQKGEITLPQADRARNAI